METTSHLHRMAEELKCPICLSLLKSAVSLTCNHIFCNVCIDKSMKSDSTCPVCKIPYRRREIRPAPHMDTLVSIYKSMEVSSGVNILVTQTEPQTADNENQKEDDIVRGSKTSKKACIGTPNTQNQRKSKGKTLKGSLKRPKRCNSDLERPSFPTKKRIRVPQHPPQETPTRPANLEVGKGETVEARTQTNVLGPDGTTLLHENGETLFTPFFWLRNEEDTQKTTQLAPFEPINVSPPDGTCFSDIKDFDDQSCPVTSKDVNMFDSEMFEWTQRPCSPELCASPVKMQDKAFIGCESAQGNRHKNMTVEQETDNTEVALSTLSPPQTNKADPEAKVKGSKKRAKKISKHIRTKRVKRNTNEVAESCTVPINRDQDNGINTSESGKCKTQNRKKSKVIATAFDGKDSIHGDGSTVDNTNNVNSIDEKKQESSNKQHAKKTKRSKNQNPINSNDNFAGVNNDLISQLHGEPSLDKGKIKASASRKQTEKGQVSKESKTSKKVTFNINKGSNVNSVEHIPTSVNVATKASQPLGENCTGKSNAMFLQKCDTLSHIRCAFCPSKEESNISGCMTLYLKGKPIALDHEQVSRAIHAHRSCTEWAPNVYFEDDIVVNLEAELARSKRIKCTCCGLKGAALGCYEKSCRKVFISLVPS